MKSITKAGIICLSTLLFFSCKKNGTTLLGTKDHLAGSWKVFQQGSDLNNNSKFDFDEKNLVPDSAIVTLQLKKDGTGFRVGPNNIYVDTLSWDLFNNESTLHLAIADKGFINNQYFKYEYSNSTLLLRDTTVSPNFFRYYNRQD
jgi:hypothetical protein